MLLHTDFSRAVFKTSVVGVSGASALYAERTAIILGFFTLISAIALLASCRVVPSILQRLHKDPMQSRFYKVFNKGHYYYWWFFGITLVLHFATAFFHTGFPVPGDPDASIHWIILALGFTSFLFFLLVIFSCRILITFWNFIAGRSPIENRFNKWIYSRHGLWWWLFALSILTHVIVAYAHAGIWPK